MKVTAPANFSKSLLEMASKERRGKLKVFLGMAPGVGKTYAMLSAARALKAENVDVVVGVGQPGGQGGAQRHLAADPGAAAVPAGIQTVRSFCAWSVNKGVFRS